MTEKERKEHEENLNALKTLFNELRLEIAGKYDSKGWTQIKTYINNRALWIVVYSTGDFGIKYDYKVPTIKRLKEELEKMIKQ